MFDLERESLIEPTSTYVVYSDDGGNWRVQAVPVSEDSFESRKPLPEVWRGVRDDALSKISGVEGCVFVHASGFIGGRLHYSLQKRPSSLIGQEQKQRREL